MDDEIDFKCKFTSVYLCYPGEDMPPRRVTVVENTHSKVVPRLLTAPDLEGGPYMIPAELSFCAVCCSGLGEVCVPTLVFDFEIDEDNVTKYFNPYKPDSARIKYSLLPDDYANPDISPSPIKMEVEITNKSGAVVNELRDLTVDEQRHQLLWWDGKDNSDNVVDIEKGHYEVKFELTYKDETEVEKSVSVYPIEVDLDIAGLDDNAEETPGCFLNLNLDDDNSNAIRDYEDILGSVSGENDLVKLTINSIKPSDLPGQVTLWIEGNESNISVWEHPEKAMLSVTLPQDYNNSEDLPKDLWIEGINPSIELRDVKITLDFCPDDGGIVSDDVDFTVMNCNLSTDINLDETIDFEDDSKEEYPGAVVYLNHDDDDKNGIMDKDEDNSEDEDDLKRFKIDLGPYNLFGEEVMGTVKLRRKGSKIRLWSDEMKGSDNEILYNNNEKLWDFSNPQDLSEFIEIKDNLWVEGYEKSIGERDETLYLGYTPPAGEEIEDGVDITIPEVLVLMTFDDGPEGDEPLGSNSTETILNILESNPVQNNIKAVFFPITHLDEWGGSPLGVELLQRENTDGHVVAVHGGGKGDHITHIERVNKEKYPPYAVGPNGEVDVGDVVGEYALESDMVAAIRRLRYIFSNPAYNPEFVRPPKWERDSRVLNSYNAQVIKDELGTTIGLKMILRDIYGKDGGSSLMSIATMVKNNLIVDAQGCIVNEIYDMIVVLHDSNDDTAENLVLYLQSIKKGLSQAGCNAVVFVKTEEKAREISRKKERWLHPGGLGE